MRQLRAADPDNTVLWGECRICHYPWRLNRWLDMHKHNYQGERCLGSNRPPRPGTITDRLTVAP